MAKVYREAAGPAKMFPVTPRCLFAPLGGFSIMTLRRSALALSLLSSLALVGCSEKKPVEPPKPVEVAKPAEPPKPTPPPAPEEPHALKECAASLELAPSVDIKVGERAAKLGGYKLTFADKDADGVRLGILGPVNEDLGENMIALKKYVKFFTDEKATAIVVTGDVGEKASSITRVLNTLADSKLPVFVVVGNRECRAEFTDGVAAARKDHANVVNLNEVRAVEFPDLTLVSLPGYHEPNYIQCATGCRYFKSTLDEVVRVAKDAKTPVLLVSHGPPHGTSNQALDYASGGQNVGDENINRAIIEGNISFGVFSNIKEAGGRAAADPVGATLVKEGSSSKTLFYAAGPADTFGWELNDGTKSVGMAAVMTVKDGAASFKNYRMKALTAAEKAEAKKLEPTVTAEKTDIAPPPGKAVAEPQK
jgi:Icc-related predicted phosphoesterase